MAMMRERPFKAASLSPPVSLLLVTALLLFTALLLVTSLLLGGAGAANAAETATARPSVDWLIYDRNAAGYDIDRDAGDAARHEITPTWMEDGAAAAPPHHVALIIPKRSVAAYSISVNTILATFRERREPARFSVWYYESREEIAAEAFAWAEAEGVDLIMTVGSDATAVANRIYRGEGLIPVVTSASKDPVLLGQTEDYDRGSGDNFAFTSINLKVETLVPQLREVFPRLENIWVLYASKNISAVQTQLRPLIGYAEAHPEQRLRIGEVMITNQASARADLAERMPAAVAEITALDPDLTRSIFWITGSTSVYAQIAVINHLAAGVPVLAALPDVVRPGADSAVLSIGVNQSSAVHLAALYALRILVDGADPGALPVGQVSPPDIAINFLKVEETGLRLPFSFFEDATFIYDRAGAPAREFGQRVRVN